MFQKAAYFPSVCAVTVANGEEVAVFKPEHVWICYVGILVDLHRVVRRNASFGCK